MISLIVSLLILVILILLSLLWKRRKRPSIHLVVSRYNENISWLFSPPFNRYPSIVYEKSPNPHPDCVPPPCERILLPNVGRCDHTYLYYIITHYHNLPEKIIFLPGSVQSPLKLSNAQHIMDIIEDDDALNEYFKAQSEHDMKPGLYHFTLDEWQASDTDNQKINRERVLKQSPIRPFGKWFEHHFSETQKIHGIWYSGVFASTRDRIRRHPLRLYQRLIRDVETHSNPEVGHYIERSWFSLFGDSPITK